MKKLLRDQRVYRLLEGIDEDLAEQARVGGCPDCGGRLHRGNYKRKPRGGPDWERRHSFCCAVEGCRKRKTPPSVRYLGRKVYVGVVVVLVSAMMHGCTAQRVGRLGEVIEIDARTLAHWRKWWAGQFVGSGFWKARRARFMPLLEEGHIAHSLVEKFGADQSEGLLRLMKYLSPITTNCCEGVVAM